MIFEAIHLHPDDSAATLPLPHHIALIGNALPRRCGLATFTSDTMQGLLTQFPAMAVDLYAMDDATGVAYAADVHTITADDPLAYRRAAAEIEASGAQAIWLQHEYGIFGGSAGDYILTLLERSTLPLIVTLHTVLEAPDADQRRVLDAIVRRADHVIVMAELGRRILTDTYGVAAARISVIPHGVPDRALVPTDSVKARFGLAGRQTILTFGLLAPDKGIEGMIAAMPAVVAAQPAALYIVLGATHPNLKRQAGEAYRDQLMAQARSLGVADHVRFVDAFVDQPELLDWLQAADVYVTPYRKRDQITSGTLAFAVGLGKPVVSTPYIHATEILNDGHGVLVDFDSSVQLAQAVAQLLGHDETRLALAARAYARGRTMTWGKSSEAAVALIASSLAAPRPPRITSAAPGTIPRVNVQSLERMTDGTGLLQHAIHAIPDRRHGYCIDDNARALILAVRLPTDQARNQADNQAANQAEARDGLAATYAAFVQHAWNPDERRFRNFMRYDRSWCEDAGSNDSNGRTLWALGVTAAEAPQQHLRDWAIALFDESASLALALESPRARAFAVLGAASVLSAHPGHGLAHEIVERSATLLLRLFDAARRPGWTWFEAELAYDNARLAEAMLRAGTALDNAAYRDCGLVTLDWMVAQQTAEDGHFRPVGTDSFFRSYAAPLRYDQQPLEAQATIDACAAAFAATRDARWLDAAMHAFRWYQGANDLSLPLASRGDGGCFDGLMPHGLNRNQGAESILALQLSIVAVSGLPISGHWMAHSGVAA